MTQRPLIWLREGIKTPPFSAAARIQAGYLLRLLQEGESVGMPFSRPMPGIGPRCHELRINDRRNRWRIIYRIDNDAIVVVEIFKKKSRQTPETIIRKCRRIIGRYDRA